MDDLGNSTLSDRRKDACLNLFDKAVCGKVAIPVDKLKQPTKVTRFSNGTTFTAITTRTDAYKFLFFPHTVRELNSLTLGLYRIFALYLLQCQIVGQIVYLCSAE